MRTLPLSRIATLSARTSSLIAAHYHHQRIIIHSNSYLSSGTPATIQPACNNHPVHIHRPVNTLYPGPVTRVISLWLSIIRICIAPKSWRTSKRLFLSAPFSRRPSLHMVKARRRNYIGPVFVADRPGGRLPLTAPSRVHQERKVLYSIVVLPTALLGLGGAVHLFGLTSNSNLITHCIKRKKKKLAILVPPSFIPLPIPPMSLECQNIMDYFWMHLA